MRPSFLSDALASLDNVDAVKDSEARHKALGDILNVASTVFGAASDTTTDAILIFLFALATHPDVRKRVQNELDTFLTDRNEFGEYSEPSSSNDATPDRIVNCRETHAEATDL